MNAFTDANIIYDAMSKAIKPSIWKTSSQYYSLNQLLETARLQRDLENNNYEPDEGTKFIINERGKTRYITSNTVRDRTVNNILCDEVLNPAISPYIIYENTASQLNKGVKLFREILEKHIHEFYRKNGSNKGYIALGDFTGYYHNLHHDKCSDLLNWFINKSDIDTDTVNMAIFVLSKLFETFQIDVSRFSDDEIIMMYKTKINPLMNLFVDERLLTGKKMLRKGINIGARPSQDIGIIYPYKIDNYATIVSGLPYGRYTDDFYAISDNKKELSDFLFDVDEMSKEIDLIINPNKTFIVQLDKPFNILQTQYTLTESGKLLKKISSTSINREHRRLLAYHRQFCLGSINYETIESAFKSWIGSNYKIMSYHQIIKLFQTYYKLFNTKITWEKDHSKLVWLMNKALS